MGALTENGDKTKTEISIFKKKPTPNAKPVTLVIIKSYHLINLL